MTPQERTIANLDGDPMTGYEQQTAFDGDATTRLDLLLFKDGDASTRSGSDHLRDGNAVNRLGEDHHQAAASAEAKQATLDARDEATAQVRKKVLPSPWNTPSPRPKGY